MKRHFPSAFLPGIGLASAALLAAPSATAGNYEPFDEFVPLIEINATDGDIGYHVLLDGPRWHIARILDSDRDAMFRGKGKDDLFEQGITELFMESSEPPCNPEDVEDGEEVVTLETFIDRFEAGVYHARGWTIGGSALRAEADLTHNIPAAPATWLEIETEIDEDGEEELEVEISWTTGTDLGRCEFQSLVDAGVIPHPADVEVVRWEVVVEPDDEELPEGLAFAKFTMQFPAGVNEVEVPEEYFEPYLEANVTDFKSEVGAREASGNQTFTEFEFSLGEDEEEED